jgi:ankyrin repeat protein
MPSLNDELSEAARAGSMETCMSLIVRGADPSASGPDGATPLLKASLGGYIDICRMLLERDVDVGAAARDGRTPLIVAASSERANELCRILLEKGADVTAATFKGWTALQAAVAFSNLGICRLLVAHGASPTYLAPGLGAHYLSPFQKAVQQGETELVRFFIDECGEDIAQRTRDGRTMLNLAGSFSDIKAILRSAKTQRSVMIKVSAPPRADGPHSKSTDVDSAALAKSKGMSPL